MLRSDVLSALHFPIQQIMISYRHTDSEFAFKVEDWLQDRGYKVSKIEIEIEIEIEIGGLAARPWL